MRAYNDPVHRAYKAQLAATVTPCWRCGKRATSPDHDPPLAHHRHVRGSGCCVLKPSCGKCQSRQGAAIVNARRASGYDW